MIRTRGRFISEWTILNEGFYERIKQRRGGGKAKIAEFAQEDRWRWERMWKEISASIAAVEAFIVKKLNAWPDFSLDQKANKWEIRYSG
jgi:hypothetical protein